MKKHELIERKFTESFNVEDYEILTDTGFVDLKFLHKTIPYDVFELKLIDGKCLRCADDHIVFYMDDMEEVFVKDLKTGEKICTLNDGVLSECEVASVEKNETKEEMYDFQLVENSNKRYYTNGILSHNTFLIKEIAKKLFESEDAVIRFDMSEYSMPHEVAKLIGSPPGFVGYEEGGQLTERVKNKPYSIVLFDEFEKAHPDFRNIMLQILDEGFLTDAQGRKVNFRNTMIVMTSNIGTSKLLGEKRIGFSADTSLSKKELESEILSELKKHPTTSPEFLNRIDNIVVFNALTEEDIKKIVDLNLSLFASRLLKEKGMVVKYSTKLREFIGVIGYDKMYGARPLKRAIANHIEKAIADAYINQIIKDGDKFTVDIKDDLVFIKK